jgi:mono/diheme cytochrome c family protein
MAPRLGIACFALLLGFASLKALQANEQNVDYFRDIKSVLKERCFACHGALKQESKLRLDTAAAIRQGGESGPAVIAGDSKASILFDRVSSSELATRMPPEGEPLTPKQLEKLKAWIEGGARSPAQEAAEPDPRDHWAFRPPQEPSIPSLPASQSSGNAIDALILAQLEREGIAPRPLVDKATWLRRVTIDQIGLPPTSAELNAFESDESVIAYRKVVDRLLADPRYGERWGRHWMDVWRYADWHGRRYVPDVWNSAPQIWRWRDWIVRSLNEERPYDQMVREMLAADEVAPEDERAAPATGYLIRNWYALNPNDWMRANVEHVGKAFLGLTFNCAHCHDHKYDPISQEDYFRIRAFFEPLGIRQDRVPGEPDPGPFQEYTYSALRNVQRLGMVRVFDKNHAAPTWFYTGGDERNRVPDRGSIPPGVPPFLAPSPLKIEPISLPLAATNPASRPEFQESLLGELRSNLAQAQNAETAAKRQYAEESPQLQENLLKAKTEWRAAARRVAPDAKLSPLSGAQSLLLFAAEGRRTLQHPLSAWNADLEGATISFQLRILTDSHFNFQLSKNQAQGLTASVVAFEKGRIIGYQPKTTTEFQVGAYDLAGGERSFNVTLTLEPSNDRCLLSVDCRESGKRLVNQIPVALGDWKPAQGILLDARPGSVVAFDEFRIAAKSIDGQSQPPLIAVDFESTRFSEISEIDGVEGWCASHFSEAPAISITAATLAGSDMIEPTKILFTAAQAMRANAQLPAVARAKVESAAAELASLESKLAVEKSKQQSNSADAPAALTREAFDLHRTAKRKSFVTAELAAQQVLAEIHSLPLTDETRKKSRDAATKLGAARVALDQAQMADKTVVNEAAYPALGPTYPAQSTGRRKALAEWMTSPQNPLTARVAVNHIWMRHFHSPLVASVFDFGRSGAAPTHPELLDYLAVRLMNSQWSMKDLHRQIVLSDAYRRSTVGNDPVATAVDPDNRMLWRMNRGRMEAEVVRDSLIYLAGKLDSRIGGQELENEQALTTFRRTIYYSCQPEGDGKSQFGALFDAPESTDCYRRTRSIIPQQALALTNNEFVHEVSRELATRVERSLPTGRDDESFIHAAYLEILTRPPSREELDVCMKYLTSDQSDRDQTRQRGGLIRVLLNHHDFISIR